MPGEWGKGTKKYKARKITKQQAECVNLGVTDGLSVSLCGYRANPKDSNKATFLSLPSLLALEDGYAVKARDGVRTWADIPSFSHAESRKEINNLPKNGRPEGYIHQGPPKIALPPAYLIPLPLASEQLAEVIFVKNGRRKGSRMRVPYTPNRSPLARAGYTRVDILRQLEEERKRRAELARLRKLVRACFAKWIPSQPLRWRLLSNLQKDRAAREYQRLTGHPWLLSQKKARISTVKMGEGLP
ncbi:hypothetical protein BKA70DRAFT_1225387 [Coprinopsis sp. MPI-PUGE-AT-0042]|nr:hypothetical protein BKA70DRAFT_1225387 [Coprinopsis sp. MPI-PUGE-AT-0042]